jgi:hypothetical protein
VLYNLSHASNPFWFIFQIGSPAFPRAGLWLQSSYLWLLSSWDYSCDLLCLAQFFFKCLVNVASEAMWAWTLLLGKFKISNKPITYYRSVHIFQLWFSFISLCVLGFFYLHLIHLIACHLVHPITILLFL